MSFIIAIYFMPLDMVIVFRGRNPIHPLKKAKVSIKDHRYIMIGYLYINQIIIEEMLEGNMGWIGILYVAGMLMAMSTLTLGGYILQRDRYWMRIWENIGKPEVKSIRELKAYITNQSCMTTNLDPSKNNIGSEER